MLKKLMNSSIIFIMIFIAVGIAFYFFPPVSFYFIDTDVLKDLSTEIDLEGNRKILIIFFAIMFSISFLVLTSFAKHSKKNLDQLNSVLEQITDENSLERELYQTRKIFEHTILTSPWQKYEKTIRHIPDGFTEDGEIKTRHLASVEANLFFNEEIVQQNIPRYKFNNYAPQMLTALGLFGTFFGIVTGLDGIDFTDVTNTTESVIGLLSGVQISFRTSLYGLAFSIILTIQQKFLLQAQESVILKIGDRIDTIFPMNTQEDGINQLYVELEKQTASIQKMGTEIAEAVSDKFDIALQKNMGPTLEKFTETTEQLFEIVKNSNQAALSSIVDNIGTIISSSTSQELERLQSSIGMMTERNEKLLSEFDETVRSLQSLIESQQSVIIETNQSADNVQQVKESMVTVTNELTNIISNLTNFAGIQQASYDGYHELVNKVQEVIHQQEKSMTMYKEIIEESLQASLLQKSSNEQFAMAIDKLEEFNTNFSSILENMESQVEQFAKASEHINDSLAVSMKNLGETHEAISKSISELTSNLDVTIKDFDDLIADNLSELIDEYRAIMENMTAFSEKSDIMLNQLNSFVDTNEVIVGLWDSYKGSFDELNLEINKGVENYTANIRDGLQKLFADYDEHISKVLSEFKVSIDSFQGTLDELCDILENQDLKSIQQANKKVIEEGSLVIQSFGEKMDELMDLYRQVAVTRVTRNDQ